MQLVNGNEPVLFVRMVSVHATVLCLGLYALCVCKGWTINAQIIHALLLFLKFFQTLCTPGKQWKGLFFPIFSRQNRNRPIGKMRSKDFETLYPVSTGLCVSQHSGPIIHSSFPYLSLLRMKDKQKPKSSWLAWCFCMKALLLSRPSLHPVPTSLQPWPYIIFQAQCSSSSSPFSSSSFSQTLQE